MREGSAEVSVSGGPDAAFAWLVDPRNAGAWFANVALPEPPERPLRVGAMWRFIMTRQGAREIPMRLADYQPPARFTWETTYPRWRDNLAWTITLSPEPDTAERPDAPPTTRLRLTISQRPGPLGWPSLLLAGLLARLSPSLAASMEARAERAAQRAAEALAATPTISSGAYERHGSRQRGGTRSKSGRGHGRRR
ncbi:MAG TPA: SRPBCC family protein [Ktedonobacterales bacterium]